MPLVKDPLSGNMVDSEELQGILDSRARAEADAAANVARNQSASAAEQVTKKTPRYTTPTDLIGQQRKEAFDKANKFDENAIYNAERARVQSMIDAINDQYNSVTAPQLEEDAAQALGRNRALQASGGLQTAPRGVAMTQNTVAANNRVRRAEEAKLRLQIEGILVGANQRAAERVDKERELARQDRESYLSYVKDQQNQARTDLIGLFKTGFDPSTLSGEQASAYQQLLEQSGLDEFSAELFRNANSPEQKPYDVITTGDKLTAVYVNPKTGEITTKVSQSIAGLQEGVKYKVQQMDDGTVLAVPDSIDPEKPLDEQIIMYGSKGQYAKPKAAGSGGGSGKSSEGISKEETAFYKDVDAAQDDLRSGANWGEVYNKLKAKWGAPDDVLDSLLNKDFWYKEGAFGRFNESQ